MSLADNYPMTSRTPLLIWVAIVVAVLAIVPIVAATMMVASIIWIPLLLAFAIAAVALLLRSRREEIKS